MPTIHFWIDRIHKGEFPTRYDRLKVALYGSKGEWKPYFSNHAKIRDLKGAPRFIDGVIFLEVDQPERSGLSFHSINDLKSKNRLSEDLLHLFDNFCDKFLSLFTRRI